MSSSVSSLLISSLTTVLLKFCRSANHRVKEEDTIVQMAITICCAYLSFFTAEYVVGVSGVLCCCAAALTLSCYAQPLFLKPESLHTIWGAFEWIGNTLIFIFAGLIIGSRSIAYVDVADLGYIVVVYLCTFVIRGFTLLLAYPAIRLPALGKPTSPKEAVFMTWVGMRGAVSMALALSLLHSAEQGNVTVTKGDSHIVFFLVGGEVLLNLLINATTAAPLLDFLKLIDKEQTAERVMMFNFVRKRVRVKAAELLDQLKESRPDQIDVDVVTSYCSILRTYESESNKHAHTYSFDDRDSEVASIAASRTGSTTDLIAGSRRGSATDIVGSTPQHRGSAEGVAMASALARRAKMVRRNSDIIHDDAEDLHAIPEVFERPQQLPALMSRIRRAFLEVVRVSYKQQINSGKLPRNATCVLVLLNSVEAALERVDETGMHDWEMIERKYQSYFVAEKDRFFFPETLASPREREFSRVPPVDTTAQDHLSRLVQDFRDAQVIYLLTSFIDAHHYAQKRIPYYLGETYSIDTPEEARVVQESRIVVARAQAHLAAMNPHVVTLQVSKQTARWILHRQEDQVEGFQREGIIPEADAEILLHQAAADLKALGKLEWSDIVTAMGERVTDSLDCTSRCRGDTSSPVTMPIDLSRWLSRTNVNVVAENA